MRAALGPRRCPSQDQLDSWHCEVQGAPKSDGVGSRSFRWEFLATIRQFDLHDALPELACFRIITELRCKCLHLKRCSPRQFFDQLRIRFCSLIRLRRLQLIGWKNMLSRGWERPHWNCGLIPGGLVSPKSRTVTYPTFHFRLDPSDPASGFPHWLRECAGFDEVVHCRFFQTCPAQHLGPADQDGGRGLFQNGAAVYH